ncbi:head completion/stabilization protein [Stenotrophomonas geniculata]|uniref:Head completion/stabilization protein n=1 Tax=Stenotrophomonas geniculata N1 TaxID=1167641 RepID=A0A0L8A6Q0_9GAMM|nr:head completion/stabilization protein [Stenotrophomonas geniculata]KOE97849.1 head completion/stabilization protein [Stenotrophomonas geniculata N1]
MSSFVANASPVPKQPNVSAGAFWPEIDVAVLRETIRVPGDIQAPRMRSTVVSAVMDVTRELEAWQAGKEAAGYATLADVPAPVIDGSTRLVHLFLRAVGCATAVELHERYRSYDATAQGNQRAEELTPTIDEIRRDLRNTLCDLQGLRRVTVELI